MHHSRMPPYGVVHCGHSAPCSETKKKNVSHSEGSSSEILEKVGMTSIQHGPNGFGH